MAANPYTPTSALAQATMAASRTLSELVVVREWLHDTAPPPPHPDASTGYWRFTKHRVTQGLWTGNTGRAADSVVREMDPDSVVREAEAGRSLAADDAVRYDLPLVLLVGSDVISSELRQGAGTYTFCLCPRGEHRRRDQALSRCASALARGNYPRFSSLLLACDL